VSLKILVFLSSGVRNESQPLTFLRRWGVQILVFVTVFPKYLNFEIISNFFLYISGTILAYISTNRLSFLIAFYKTFVILYVVFIQVCFSACRILV